MRPDDTVPAAVPEKRCTACGGIKPLTEFHRYHRPERGPGWYRRSRCKPCFSAPRPTYPSVECASCGQSFKVKPAVLATGNGKYCSAACYFAALRTPTDPITFSDDGITARIPLHARDGSVRAHAVIDASDAAWAGQWNWHLNDSGYAARNQWDTDDHCHEFRLHRELLGLRPGDGLEGDHIDRDKLNCRRENLRALPLGKNAQNRPSDAGSSSPYRGVSFDKRINKWRAYTQVDGQRWHLGTFDSEEEAADVAREARLRYMPYAVD